MPVFAASIWLVYMADRVLDAAVPSMEVWEPLRKRFYRRHLPAAALLTALAALLILPFSFVFLRPSVFRGGLLLSLALAAYFAIVHFAPPSWLPRWPRQFVIAVMFTLGTFLALWIGAAQHRSRLLAPAVLFFLLCWLNCAAIEFWEWRKAGADPTRSLPASTGSLGRNATPAAVAFAFLGIVFAWSSVIPLAVGLAGVLSAFLLALIATRVESLSAEFLPVAADLALCTPLLVMPVLWLR